MIEDLDAKTLEDLEKALADSGFSKKTKDVIIDYYARS
jgi:hypothetical protein